MDLAKVKAAKGLPKGFGKINNKPMEAKWLM